MKFQFTILSMFSLVICASCGGGASSPPASDGNENVRNDNAVKLNINLTGSLQNPAFSPDGNAIVFTRFRDGYNMGASDLYTFDLVTEETTALMSDGESNVNLPGSSWSGVNNSVVFSSAREPHDEIFVISAAAITGQEIQITDRPGIQSYEPSFSADGLWVVFESHVIDVDDDGVITKFKIDGSSDYIALTESDNNKQPNWSPVGGKILYQKEDVVNGGWAIWTMDDDSGGNKLRITGMDESATDAVFSNDGQSIIYSGENENVVLSNIYSISSDGRDLAQRITNYDGYDGAPSISGDGLTIVFESVSGDPDISAGTAIWMIDISN